MTYSYEALRTPASIRLFEVFPANYDDRICGSMHQIELEQVPLKQPNATEEAHFDIEGGVRFHEVLCYPRQSAKPSNSTMQSHIAGEIQNHSSPSFAMQRTTDLPESFRRLETIPASSRSVFSLFLGRSDLYQPE